MTLRILGRIFFTGLATMLPLAVTLAILIWLGAAAERVLGKIVKLMIPDHLYLPGMGILLGILLTLLVGLLARAWLFRRIFRYGDRLFNRIPLIKSVYGAVQDFMHFMSGSSEKQFDRVVTVDINGMRLMGFVTCAESETLPAPLGDEERIAVYFPMSYQIGGYTLFIPRHLVTPVDLATEDAMRFVLTAGLSGRPKAEEALESDDPAQ
ncbi:MAG TPA: DUF502 domain-containing protein [Gammaproteobacteria bacterium]|nr:DUF502 domain-containing protein [Gammaproteobacteria bacterium]